MTGLGPQPGNIPATAVRGFDLAFTVAHLDANGDPENWPNDLRVTLSPTDAAGHVDAVTVDITPVDDEASVVVDHAEFDDLDWPVAWWWLEDPTAGVLYNAARLHLRDVGTSGVGSPVTSAMTVTVGTTTLALTTTGGGGGGGGVSDHGALTGLADDDHTQYAKRASDLADLASAATARTNLGLGTMAVEAATDYEYQSSVLAAAANLGGPLVGFDNFAAHADGSIHDETTIGHGTADPITWGDGLVGSPLSEPFLDTCVISSGRLQHEDGDRLAAAASVLLPTVATRRTVSVAWADPVAGPGQIPSGDPYYGGADPTGYCSLRLNFIDVDATLGDGYVCYVEQDSDVANHFVRIVRDDNQDPTGNDLVGPVDLGRRLTDGEVLTFGYFDNTYFVLVSGTEVCRATDDTYDPATFDSTGIVLNTQGNWLPGAYWWAMSDGIPAVVDANTNAADITTIEADIAALEAADTAGVGAPIIAAARFNGTHENSPLVDFNGNSLDTTRTVLTGQMYVCQRVGAAADLTRLDAEIITPGTAGQFLHVGCYEVLDDGGPGELLWSTTALPIDVTGRTSVALTETLPARAFLAILNPSGNSTQVVMLGGYTFPKWAGYGNSGATGFQRSGTVDATGLAALPADMTGWTIGQATSTSSRLRVQATGCPLLAGRA